MPEISDEFKIIIIDAVRSLCLKFPAKQQLMLSFLSSVLRDEGGYEYKRAIVEAIFDVIYHIPDSKEEALSHLCEFIEDCEFNKLAVRIIHLIGSQGPSTRQPSIYIRYIYNRVILESATVRAAAVCSLAKFAIKCPDLKERIIVLLQRCLDDVDDEVRDRAAMYLKIVVNQDLSRVFIDDDSVYSWNQLETQIQNYIKSESKSESFDISRIQVVSKIQERCEVMRQKIMQQEIIHDEKPIVKVEPQETIDLLKIPQFQSFGAIFKTSPILELTEKETEYVVTCQKHVFKNNIVFQFNVKNTLQECQLESVSVKMTSDSDSIQASTLLIQKLMFGVPASCFSVWQGNEINGTFTNSLKFIVKEVDVSTGEMDEQGYDDEYAVYLINLVGGCRSWVVRLHQPLVYS